MIYIDFFGCSVICLNYSTDCFTSPFIVLTRKYLVDVDKVGWQDRLGDGQAGLTSSRSPLFLETENTPPSITLKGQCDAP